MAVETEGMPDELPQLAPALQVDLDDPEVARARAAIEAQLLGVPLVPTRIGRFVVLERLGAGGMGIVYAAFDPQLDRKVAIKLLFERGAAETERVRLVGEAKAMAKLAHPNVVHVYEVGEHRGQLFVAMEHVRGRTLRRWCSESAPTVREILSVCIQAGEGLAAAHAAGIVHRDFKPDNVLVDDDARGDAAIRRVRVLDFGLARTIEEPTASDIGIAESDGAPQTATRTGACMGTPGYVAPEQIRGATADHLADQFAFCVTTWEALVGTPPFVGDNSKELLDAILHGSIRPPPRAKMPAWVERVLRRGLSDVRDAPHRGRYANLDELLRTLGRDPAALRRRRVGLAAVAGGVVAAFAIGNAFRSQASDDPCSGAADTIDEAWPVEERAAALARIVALGGAYGATIAPRLDADADAFAETWSAGHRDACLAHRRGEQSAELLDRRMVCLHRDRSAFAALGRITAATTADALPQLVIAFAALPDPLRCSDLPALSAIEEPPPVEALPLSERLAEIQMLYAAADNDAALAASMEVVADARRLGYRPFIAEALVLHSYGVIERGDRRGGARELLEATTLALAVGDDRLALRAWGSGAWAVATDKPADDGLVFDGRALMTAIAERHADEPAAIGFYTRLGGIELANGRPVQAREAYRRALAIGAQLEAGSSELALTKQGLALVTEDPVARERLLAESVAGTTEKYGAEHPRTLGDGMIRALNLDDPRAGLAEVEPICAAWHTFHPLEKQNIAECERELAEVAELLGEGALALAATDRWVSAGGEDLAFAKAMAALRHGNAAAAATLLEPKVRELERERTADAPFFVLLGIAEAELALGRAWRALGDPRAAAMLDRALADTERGADGQAQPAVQRRLAHARLVIERG